MNEGYDQKFTQSNPTLRPKNKKKGEGEDRKGGHTRIDKRLQKTPTLNQIDSFPQQVVIHVPLAENSSNIYFDLFSYFNYKSKQLS